MHFCMAGFSGLDWSLVQVYLAVAESGSLSAASRTLGVAQPTIGRQIRALEEQLGLELFQRHDKGLTLTNPGRALLAPAQAMRLAASHMELQAVGSGREAGGTVRIAASVVVSTYHLPAIVASLRLEHPQITIEIVPGDESSNLLFREADVALRMYRPTQLELVTQHLGDFRLGAFAARSYVERRGIPKQLEEIVEHDVIGFDRHSVMLEAFQERGYPVDREWFKVRVDDQAVYWELVRAGCGIGFGQCTVGRRDPDLVEIPIDFGLPLLPVWLTAHEAVRRTPRVEAVWDKLACELRDILSSPANRGLDGDPPSPTKDRQK